LQAALTAAENGHPVVLLEREKDLGGQLNLASIPPNKGEIRNLMTYFSGQLLLHRDKIQVRREEANPSKVKELKPDAVISAVGSVPLIPEIPGIQEAIKNKKVVTGRELLSGKMKAGKKTVVIGGGMIGCEIACDLAEKGHEVSLIEILPELAMDAFSHIRKVLVRQISLKSIRVHTGVKEERIKQEGVEIVDSGGKRLFIETDTIILSAGSAPNSALSRSFQGTAPEFYEVGDCREARRILEAIHSGDEAARKL
jgi:pyruvate/2-oxoglutarate dehydrogenase complex dihydrolipoamide dehydrogenase (E3) component